MDVLLPNLYQIKVPTPSDKVYKDECLFSFDNPVSAHLCKLLPAPVEQILSCRRARPGSTWAWQPSTASAATTWSTTTKKPALLCTCTGCESDMRLVCATRKLGLNTNARAFNRFLHHHRATGRRRKSPDSPSASRAASTRTRARRSTNTKTFTT